MKYRDLPWVALLASAALGAAVCSAVQRYTESPAEEVRSTSNDLERGHRAYAMSVGLMLPPDRVHLATFHGFEGTENCAGYVADLLRAYPSRKYWCE